jgi:hypothetical protein
LLVTAIAIMTDVNLERRIIQAQAAQLSGHIDINRWNGFFYVNAPGVNLTEPPGLLYQQLQKKGANEPTPYGTTAQFAGWQHL